MMTPTRRWQWQWQQPLITALCAVITMVITITLCTNVNGDVTKPYTVKLGMIQILPGGDMGYLLAENQVEPSRDAWEFYAASHLAIMMINNQTSVLPNHTIVLEYMSDGYTPGSPAVVASLEMMDPVRNPDPPLLVFGLLSSDIAQIVAFTSEGFNVPVMSDFATALSLSDKGSFPTFSRVVGSDVTEAAALVSIITHFGWQRIAILSTSDASPSQTADSLATQCDNAGISVYSNRRITIPTNVITLDPYDNSLYAPIRAHLQAIKDSGSRIIVASVFTFVMRMVLRVAINMSMCEPPYQWIGTTQWSFDADLLTDPELRDSLTGLLSLTLYPSAEAAYVSAPNTAGYRFTHEWEAKYRANPNNTFQIPSPRISALRYDNVWLIARALENMFVEQIECNNTRPTWMPICNSTIFVSQMSLDGYYAVNLNMMKHQWARCCAMWLDDAQLSPQTLSFPPGTKTHEARGYVITYHIRHAIWTDGVSGIIELDLDTGDRLAHYGVVNARGTAYGDADGLYRIGEFIVTDIAGAGYINVTTRPIWPGNATTIPRDAPIAVIRILRVADGVIYLIYAVTACVMCSVFTVFFFNCKYRHVKVIKMSSPHINNLMLLGFMMVLTFVMLYGVNGDSDFSFDFLCNVRLWLLSLGFTVAFGGLFAKTYRVHKIFNSEKLKVADKLQDIYLFKFVGGLLLFDFFVLTAWTIPDPLTKQVTDFSSYYELAGDQQLFGSWLAWSTRNVAIPALNDSKQIGEAIYNVALIGGLLLGVSLLVSSNVTISYLIPALGVDFICISVLLQIFGSKIKAVWRMDDTSTKAHVTPPGQNPDSHSSSEMTKRLHDLEHENTQLRHRLGMPARAMNGGGGMLAGGHHSGPPSPNIGGVTASPGQRFSPSPGVGGHAHGSAHGHGVHGHGAGSGDTTITIHGAPAATNTWAASRQPAGGGGGGGGTTTGHVGGSPGKSHTTRAVATMNHNGSIGRQQPVAVAAAAAAHHDSTIIAGSLPSVSSDSGIAAPSTILAPPQQPIASGSTTIAVATTNTTAVDGGDTSSSVIVNANSSVAAIAVNDQPATTSTDVTTLAVNHDHHDLNSSDTIVPVRGVISAAASDDGSSNSDEHASTRPNPLAGLSAPLLLVAASLPINGHTGAPSSGRATILPPLLVSVPSSNHPSPSPTSQPLAPVPSSTTSLLPSVKHGHVGLINSNDNDNIVGDIGLTSKSFDGLPGIASSSSDDADNVA